MRRLEVKMIVLDNDSDEETTINDDIKNLKAILNDEMECYNYVIESLEVITL